MIVPRPVSWLPGTGSCRLGPKTAVQGPPQLEAMLRRELATVLSGAGGAGESVSIDLGLAAGQGEEAYQLSVTPERVRIRAGGTAGAFYAVQTLKQLLPTAAFRRAPSPDADWDLRCGEITDAPRFGWRGAMLDVARHFMPLQFLFRWVDLLAAHKLNVFHLHLTDDQGWRLDVPSRPRLTEVGGWRHQTLGDGIPHGGFYHGEQLRDLVRYAAARHVTVVPEIDMPGHMTAAIAAYPELGNHPDRTLEVATGWGVIEDVLNLRPATVEFCIEVLDEALRVFPGPYVHIGGDECPTSQWEATGVEDAGGAQRRFTETIRRHLAGRGRRLVGWDEIVQSGPVPGALVMAWREHELGVSAAAEGHQVVMAPWSDTYFNRAQSADPGEIGIPQGGPLDLAHAYRYDPVAGLEGEAARRVLGTQFQIWTERIPAPREVEWQAFPRACALAEVAWSAPGGDCAEFVERLTRHHLARLEALGVEYHPPHGAHPWQRGAHPRDP